MSIIIAEDLRDEIRAHYLVPERYRIVIWALVGQKNRQGFVLKVAVFCFRLFFVILELKFVTLISYIGWNINYYFCFDVVL